MRNWWKSASAMLPLAILTAACGSDEAATSPAGDGTDQEELLERAVNESWINLEGTITSVSPSSFVMDIGDGEVTVEMDDWDWFQEGRHLKSGDRVAVTGRIDRDLLEQEKLEASSVYVENLGTYFYASGRDEEDLTDSSIYMVAPAGAVDATGFVTGIEGREFTIGTAAGSMRVDTSQLENDPLDAEGQPTLAVADRVYVWGRLDVDGREENELMAQGLVVLTPDAGKSSAEAREEGRPAAKDEAPG